MIHIRGVLLIFLCSFILTAAGCRGSQVSTQLTNLVIGREITSDNRALSPTDKISASSEKIYLSGKVSNPNKSTRVRVSWLKLPNQIIATEDFNGSNNGSNSFDFDRAKSSSYFASSIDRPGLAWTEGEYKAEVYLGSRLNQTLFFKIVSDSEAEEDNNRRIISRVSFGETIQGDLIQDPTTTLTRSAGHIYIQIELSGRQPGNKIEATIRHLREDKVINTFTATTGESQSLIFDLPLERYGRLWTDRLWASGAYQVEVKVNGVSVLTPSFVVE